MKKKHYNSKECELATFTDENLAYMFVHIFRQRFTNVLGLEVEELPDDIKRYKYHIFDVDMPNSNDSQIK